MNIFPKNISRLLTFVLSAAIVFGLQNCTKESENNFKYNDNTLRTRLSSEPRRLNPLLAPGSASRAVYEHIMLEMMDFDPESLEMVPLLLKNEPIARSINDGEYKGGIAYTFEIREEAAWDDGSPVTAKDVDFSIKLVFAPGLPPYYRPYFEFVKKLELDPQNPRKFTVYTNNKYILNEAVISNTPVYQAAHYDPKGLMSEFTLEQLNNPGAAELKDNPNLKAFAEAFTSPLYSSEPEGVSGCGPYKFEKWESGQYILLTKKQNWWGDKLADNNNQLKAYPDTLLFKIIPDQTAALNALKDQELDVVKGIDSKDFSELKNAESVTSIYNLETPKTPQIFLIYLNNRNPKLADPRLRKALAHLMDVDDFLKTLYYGFGERVTGPILSVQPYYDKSIAPIEYSLEKAKALLAEAGWADSDNDGVLDKLMDGQKTDLELEILIGTSKAVENIAVFYENSLKKAGIKLNINKKESREAISMTRKGEFELYPGAVVNDLIPFDPKEQWHSSSARPGGRNYTGFSNKMVDALIDSLRNSQDEAERTKMYHVFQAELYKNTPAVFLFNPLERIAIHKRFEAKTSFKRPGVHISTFKLKK